jgi:hypothetical protein
MHVAVYMCSVSTLGVPSLVVRIARRGDAVAPIAIPLSLALPHHPLPLPTTLTLTPQRDSNGDSNGIGEARPSV